MIKNKILFIDTPLDPPGGGQISLWHILSNLDKGKYEIYVILSRKGVFYKRLLESGFNVEVVNLSHMFFKIWKIKPDLIHCNSATTKYSFIALMAAKFFHIPFIWHNRVIDRGGWKEKFIALFSSKIIVISDAVSKKFVDFKDKVIRIYNSVDLEKMKVEKDKAILKKELKIKDEFIIGIFSRLVKWKGHKIFIEVARRLIELKYNIVFLILGDGPEYDNIKSDIIRFSLEDRVLLVGYRDNVYDYMNICDVICNLSIEEEPFGRVIIEAMALKKVVVAADSGGPCEIIEDGVDGFLVKLEVEEIVKVMIRIINDKELYNRISTNAFNKIRDRFNIKTQIDKIEMLYKEFLKGI